MNLGAIGEQTALKFLEVKGYKLVAKNFRFERAEIDLVVQDETRKLIVFVEVKTRKNKKFGEPEESVTQKKTEQICKSAEGFILQHPEFTGYEKRFDIIAIILEGKSESINHFENAF